MGIAKDIFKRLMILANEIPSSVMEQYFLPILPSVVKLAKTFPPLCKEAAEFLLQLSKTCETSLPGKSLPEVSSLTVGSDTDSIFKPVFVTGGNYGQLTKAIRKAFEEMVQTAVVKL